MKNAVTWSFDKEGGVASGRYSISWEAHRYPLQNFPSRRGAGGGWGGAILPASPPDNPGETPLSEGDYPNFCGYFRGPPSFGEGLKPGGQGFLKGGNHNGPRSCEPWTRWGQDPPTQRNRGN